MSAGLIQNLIFRVFRMLLILTGVVGAMALIFPLIQTCNSMPERPSPPPASSTR